MRTAEELRLHKATDNSLRFLQVMITPTEGRRNDVEIPSDNDLRNRLLERVPGINRQKTDIPMIDTTHLKTHRTASSLGLKKGQGPPLIGRAKEGLNSKLHIVTAALGRPVRLFPTAGNVCDHIGELALMSSLPDLIGCLLIGDMMQIGFVMD